MIYMSLFGGIECGIVAAKKLGMKIDAYYSSEIDPYAITITKKNHPEIVHLGGVKEISIGKGSLGSIVLDTQTGRHLPGTIDIIIGGPPCQDLSIAKAGGKGLEGEKSSLFYEYTRILREVKPKYFLMENVASMRKEEKEKITKELLSIYPDTVCYMFNSNKVSAQNRKRYYWTNIQGVQEPEDKGIVLRDILEDIPFDYEQWKPIPEKYITEDFLKKIEKVNEALGGKARTITASYGKGPSISNIGTHRERSLIIGQYRRTKLRVHTDQDNVCTLTSNMGTGGNNVPVVLTNTNPSGNGINGRVYHIDGKAATLSTGKGEGPKVSDGFVYRKLTPKECERLQTLPDDYTMGVSNSRRYKAIGNGWTVDIISHILSYLGKNQNNQ